MAVAPASAGNIPLQLVKANPATGMGAMQWRDVHPARGPQGGVATCRCLHCDQRRAKKQVVKYQADYIIWKAAS